MNIEPHDSSALSRYGSRGDGHISRRGFSVLELMVAAGLLVVIMLGLLAMFYQTERAFRLGLAQADILVGGRSALELIVRDLEQMRNSDYTNAANFLVALPPTDRTLQVLSTANNETRTNVLQPFFFLTRENMAWKGVRYDFALAEAKEGAATLYRMEIPPVISPSDMTNHPVHVCDFISKTNYDSAPDLYGRIAEGVIHLAIRCYDRTGSLSVPSDGVYINTDGKYYGYSFAYTNLPAFVEVELGILEPKVLARFQATPQANRKAFLERQAKRVHLFKQRIPIRTTPVPIANERVVL